LFSLPLFLSLTGPSFYDKALSCHLRHKQVADANDDTTSAFVGAYNAALIYQRLGQVQLTSCSVLSCSSSFLLGFLSAQLSEANSSFHEALGFAEKMNSLPAQNLVVGNLGLLLQRQSLFEVRLFSASLSLTSSPVLLFQEATEQFLRHLDFSSRLKDVQQQAFALTRLAEIATAENRLEDAIVYFDEVSFPFFPPLSFDSVSASFLSHRLFSQVRRVGWVLGDAKLVDQAKAHIGKFA
jgi:hypothetical protein